MKNINDTFESIHFVRDNGDIAPLRVIARVLQVSYSAYASQSIASSCSHFSFLAELACGCNFYERNFN